MGTSREPESRAYDFTPIQNYIDERGVTEKALASAARARDEWRQHPRRASACCR